MDRPVNFLLYYSLLKSNLASLRHLMQPSGEHFSVRSVYFSEKNGFKADGVNIAVLQLLLLLFFKLLAKSTLYFS